ncbi:MAG: helix-turn-helix domain-containing protein [Clostridia bacterium]|nr:helix-turn-helix domain-containing protein [Clostridia bacterium]
MTPHVHDRAEIMYVVKGRCRIRLADDERTLDVGEFVFIDAGVPHALDVDDESYMTNVEFAPEESKGLLTIGGLCRSSETFRSWLAACEAYQYGIDPDGGLYRSLSAVVDAFGHRENTEEAMQELLTGQLLLKLAVTLRQQGTRTRCLVHVRRCMRLLSERMAEDIRINDVAAELGISAAYLQRIFRQVQGVTIIEYLNQLRIERAKLLLACTDDPVVDVAMMAGFNSRQHFSRVFTACVGKSPLSYRREMQGQTEKQVFLFD